MEGEQQQQEDEKPAVTSLLRAAHYYDRWNNVFLVLAILFSEGTFADTKTLWFSHVDPVFLWIMQGGLTLVFIVFTWYTSRRLNHVHDILDASMHGGAQNNAETKRLQLATHRNIQQLTWMLQNFQETHGGVHHGLPMTFSTVE